MLYFPAPAKINLMLKVIRQETNGYHYLQTIFQFTDLFDEIGFRLRDDSQIRFTYAHTEFALEEDLIYLAIKALQSATNSTFGVDIDLIKNIPLGSGLGGGSSNAATTLIALNQLMQLNLPQSTLLQIGKELGADVPIFIRGKSAWAEGIGEDFYDIELPKREYLLIIPSISISTKVIFQSPHLSRNNPPLNERIYREQYHINDCESAIFYHYPEMKRYMNMLNELKCQPYITGTGSCMYIPRPTSEIPLKAIMNLAELEHWQLKNFTSLNHSLLHHH